MVDRVTLGQFLPDYFGLPCQLLHRQFQIPWPYHRCHVTSMLTWCVSNKSIALLKHVQKETRNEKSCKELIVHYLSIRFPAELGPGVYSASNRSEYQKHKNNNISGE
jgi:hypothetical protein